MEHSIRYCWVHPNLFCGGVNRDRSGDWGVRHRKLVTYVTYVDDSDVSTDGHGTHVCGSAAGNYVNEEGESDMPTASAYNGMAYDAKLAFFDIGDSDENLY